jgi:hypothetical protein
VSANPFDFAEPPAAPKPKPRPPSVDEAASIVTEAWKDSDWGTLIWLTMVTGNRRGELCGTPLGPGDFVRLAHSLWKGRTSTLPWHALEA